MKPSKTAMQLITIPNPCSENWNEMKASEKGRFCSKFTTVLTDFTQKTRSEIILFFKEASSRVCGRFRNDQLDLALVPAKNPSRKIRVFTCAAYLVFGSILFSCSGKESISKKDQKEETIVETRGISLPPAEISEIEENSMNELVNELNAQNEARIQEERMYESYTLGIPPIPEMEGEVIWTEELPFLNGDKIRPDSNSESGDNSIELPKIKMK